MIRRNLLANCADFGNLPKFCSLNPNRLLREGYNKFSSVSCKVNRDCRVAIPQCIGRVGDLKPFAWREESTRSTSIGYASRTSSEHGEYGHWFRSNEAHCRAVMRAVVTSALLGVMRKERASFYSGLRCAQS
jgi:hypothetical protein